LTEFAELLIRFLETSCKVPRIFRPGCLELPVRLYKLPARFPEYFGQIFSELVARLQVTSCQVLKGTSPQCPRNFQPSFLGISGRFLGTSCQISRISPELLTSFEELPVRLSGSSDQAPWDLPVRNLGTSGQALGTLQSPSAGLFVVHEGNTVR